MNDVPRGGRVQRFTVVLGEVSDVSEFLQRSLDKWLWGPILLEQPAGA